MTMLTRMWQPTRANIKLSIRACPASEGMTYAAVDLLAVSIESDLIESLNDWERRRDAADDLHKHLLELVERVEAGDVTFGGADNEWLQDVKATLLECEEIKF